MSIELTKEQRSAIEKLFQWFTSSNKNDFITLGGYAGTGKTTLISIYRKLLFKYNPKLNIAFCSYTGKASQILKTKLKEESALHVKDSVSTIHSLIYSPKVNSHDEIVGWDLKDNVSFDLIIVDEASMVDENIWKDLTSYKIPIIAVGDHGQLPPIEGKFNLMKDPVIKLEQIHRQAIDNPIIKLSIIARNEGKIPMGQYAKNIMKLNTRDQLTHDILDGLLEEVSITTLILVGYNKSRVNLNRYIRTKKFFESQSPEVGDRVICLRNNHKKGVYNGMLGTIKNLENAEKDWYFAKISMDEGINYNGLIFSPQFNSNNSINFSKNRVLTKKGDLFDFGYSLTVHKAQGSEADTVLLFEERNKHMSDDQWKRWLYTGITRAKKGLYIFGPDDFEDRL